MVVEAVVTTAAAAEERQEAAKAVVVIIEGVKIIKTRNPKTETTLQHPRIKANPIQIPSLIKRALGQLQMFQIVHVLVTGKKAEMRLIVATLWSVDGSTSSNQDRIERLASLD